MTTPFQTQTERKARKDHRCTWCLGKIREGETYIRYKGRWDDYWYDEKCCVECDRLLDLLGRQWGGWWDPDDGPSPGFVDEWAADVFEVRSPELIEALASYTQRRPRG